MHAASDRLRLSRPPGTQLSVSTFNCAILSNYKLSILESLAQRMRLDFLGVTEVGSKMWEELQDRKGWVTSLKPDERNTGVAIFSSPGNLLALRSVFTNSDRTVGIRVKAEPVDFAFICCYGPHE